MSHSTVRLKAGDWVEVLSPKQVQGTLDGDGTLAGLPFMPELYQARNTVILEGGNCGCYFSWGGCGRGERMYWREIWLKRVEEHATPAEVR